MKVVINRCYGGFSLSPKGTKRYWEIKGREVYFYEQSLEDRTYRRIDNIEDINTIFFYPTFSDQGEILDEFPEDIADNRYMERHDPALIQTVEELGREAFGGYAKLEIVEIESGRWYRIDKYDGYESIQYRDIDDEWLLAE